jgi:hypothetical protein
MTLKAHSRNETPYEVIIGGQKQISDYWTVSRLTGRKLTLLRMKKRRKAKIDTYKRLIEDLESHNESIDNEVKDLDVVLKTRMRENPEDPNNFILVRATDGYLKAKIKRAGKYRWVHLGRVDAFEGRSDDDLKKDAVTQFKANLLNKKK